MTNGRCGRPWWARWSGSTSSASSPGRCPPKTREEVTDGKTIAQPLARSKIFPQLMVDLVKIGEDTGDVPGALKNVADTYENELSIALRVMTNMIEPVMIIVMALGVGFLLLSVLSAMFAITANIAR